MRRILLAGALSVTSFGAATTAAVSWLTARHTPTLLAVADRAPSPDRQPPPEEAPPPWTAPSPSSPAASSVVAPPAPAAPVFAYAAESSAHAAHAAEDQVVAASIRRPLHRLSRGTAAPTSLFAGLQELQGLLSSCAGDARAESDRSDARSGVVLLLDVETLDGKVRIVDAPVQSRGSASEPLIRCAQRQLRGQEIAVELSQVGSRFQLPFTLRM